jgi:hypothetical protein
MIIGIFIFAIFLILAIYSTNEPQPKSNELTRKQIEYNLSDYPREYKFSVAGVHLPKYTYAVFNICKVHDLVTLIPEPNNKYDSSAIIVNVSGYEIGYVPADETGIVHDILSKDNICYVESKNILGYVNVDINIRYRL